MLIIKIEVHKKEKKNMAQLDIFGWEMASGSSV